MILGVHSRVDGFGNVRIPSTRSIENQVGDGAHPRLAITPRFFPDAQGHAVVVVLIVGHPEEYWDRLCAPLSEAPCAITKSFSSG